ncbi:MAG: hypothetical protein ACRC1K_21470, partial [Planctomycetia bacterium]
MRDHLPNPIGLYHPDQERDACGVGFVADVQGRKSHALLTAALTALGNLMHRGAVSADGLSGDGAGVLTQIPHKLFRRELATRGVSFGADGDLGVGMIFLPSAADARRSCETIVEDACKEGGLQILAWRDVPVDVAALGASA